MNGCLLVDSEHIKAWQMESLRLAMAQDLKISAVVWCTNSFTAKRPIRHAAYYLLNLLSIRNRWTRPVSWVELLGNGVPVHRFEAERSGAWQSIPDSVNEILQGYEIDVVIKFGMNLLKDPHLVPSKYGVLSFHHGDPARFRGRPAGFYELFGRYERIGVVVQQISNTLDGGTVRAFGNFKPVLHSYRKSLEHIFEWGATLLPIALSNCRANREIEVSQGGTNFRIPSNTVVVRFAFILLYRKIRRLFYGTFVRKRWELSEIELIDLATLDANVVLRRRNTIFPPVGAMFIADPFYIDDESVLCEVTEKRQDQGHIAKYNNGQFTVLDKSLLGCNRHLSYPGTVRVGDRLILVPEMAEYGAQRLVELGDDFKIVGASMIKGVEHERLIDPTVFQWNNCWWLFAGKRGSEQDLLFLWFSDSLDGFFTAHPMNPIVADPSRARGAGAIVEVAGLLYRFGQNNLGEYGDGITVSQITCLAKESYSETPIANLKTDGRSGPHTLAFAKNRQIIDSYRHVIDPLAWYPRLKSKLRTRARNPSEVK